MFILVGIGLIIVIMTLRAFLVMTGFYKTPLLTSFQAYGEEKIVSPVITFLFWFCMLAIYLLIFVVNLTGWIILVIIMGAILSATWHQKERVFKQFSKVFFRYPAWYYTLYQRTSREERRRLAYMWLFLPLRTRMVYNTHDAFFDSWVDLVLMTVTE